MRTFDIEGIRVRIPENLLSQTLTDALESGRYEWLERRALLARLKRGDRVLDLGAGVGITAVTAAQVVGGANVIAVEPNPAILDVLVDTFEQNGIDGVAIENVAVVPERESGSVTLKVGQGFWSSSLTGRGRHEVPVQALGLWDLIELHQPDVIICDLEGFEAQLFAKPMIEPPRLVIVELHPRKYSNRAIKAVFDGMSASGLTYAPHGSRGSVVVFERVEEE